MNYILWFFFAKSNVIPGLYSTEHGILFCHRCDWRRDALRRFDTIVSFWSRAFSWLHLDFWCAVATMGVAALGVGLAASCQTASTAHIRQVWCLILSSRRLASVWQRIMLHGVSRRLLARLGIMNLRPDHRRWFASVVSNVILGSSTLNVVSCFVVATLEVGLPESSLCGPGTCLGLVYNSEAASVCRRHCARRRIGSVVSIGIPGLCYAEWCVLFRRRDDWRRDAWRRFTRIVSYGVPRLVLPSFDILGWRRDDGLRFASVVLNGILSLFYAKCGILFSRCDARRRQSASTVSFDVLRSLLASFGILCRRPQRYASRRGPSVCLRHVIWHLDLIYAI
jgi:hypothetical protein